MFSIDTYEYEYLDNATLVRPYLEKHEVTENVQKSTTRQLPGMADATLKSV